MSTIEKKSLKVGKYVNTEHVDTLVRNYKKERWMQNSERIGKEDTLGLWLSIEELEDFMATAKMHGGDGIRLYFGVYGEKCPKAGMEGKQTVAFVATASETDEMDNLTHNDIYMERNGKYSLLAYNMVNPLPTIPPIVPPTGAVMKTEVGALMVADKDMGLKLI